MKKIVIILLSIIITNLSSAQTGWGYVNYTSYKTHAGYGATNQYAAFPNTRAEFDNILNFINSSRYTRHIIPLDKINFNPYEVKDLYKDFFIDLVSETFVSGSCFFWTEKSIRPMMLNTPFIVMGPVAFLSNLKNRYGFKTFSTYWDESYDNLQHYDRIQAIYKIRESLDNVSLLDRQSMDNDMKLILEHNYNRVLELNEQRR